MNFKIRAAEKNDCKDIQRMIMELSAYENVSEQVTITYKDLEHDGFCANPSFECFVAEVPENHKAKDGHTSVGYALFFYTYSTFEGRSVYLEGLYVMEEYRGRGVGKALLGKVAQVVKEKRCVRLQMSVLDRNKPSLAFYTAKGAVDLTTTEGWHMVHFNGSALDNLARDAPTDLLKIQP